MVVNINHLRCNILSRHLITPNKIPCLSLDITCNNGLVNTFSDIYILSIVTNIARNLITLRL